MEEARYDALTERRERPLRPASAATEPTGLYLAVAQTLRTHAYRRPAVGPRQVFVIGDAEALVPQESSSGGRQRSLEGLGGARAKYDSHSDFE